MPRSRLEYLIFFAGLVAVAALVLVDVRHWQRSHDAAPVRVSLATTSVAGKPVRTSKTPPPAKQSAKLATLVLSATRGDCWVSVRVGSSKGADLYEGKLTRGHEVRFAKTRLWLRLGAAGNLQATLNGRTVTTFPQGTINIFVTARGITPARAAA